MKLTMATESVEITIEDEGAGLPRPKNLFVPGFTTTPGGSGLRHRPGTDARHHRGAIRPSAAGDRDGALRRGQGYPASQLLRRTQGRVALSRNCRRYFQIDKITIQRVSRLYELTGALGIAPALTNTGVIDQAPRLNGVFMLFS